MLLTPSPTLRHPTPSPRRNSPLSKCTQVVYFCKISLGTVAEPLSGLVRKVEFGPIQVKVPLMYDVGRIWHRTSESKQSGGVKAT